jgi:YHS domain-containing protein
MIRRISLVASLSLFAFVASYVVAEDAKKEFKCNCPVAKTKAAKEDKSVEYRGAKVYFCCGGCPEAFKKDTAKYAARANMQLVETHQAEQKKCPFTGNDLNKDTKIKVGDAEVAFCCNNCKGKAEKLTGDEQIETVWGDKAFDKGFKVTAKK